MEVPVNLKHYKQALRRRFKERRRAMSPQRKAASDRMIAARLRGLRCYRKAETVLAYVSMPIEVSTEEIIDTALADRKRVAVPYCVPGTREMRFYLIDSRDELRPGSFGVPEPQPDPARLLRDFSRSVCVVPALSCDRLGHRLGYGGGYYDRFLRCYPGEKVAILYKNSLSARLWPGRYDIGMDWLVTEYFALKTAKKPPEGL